MLVEDGKVYNDTSPDPAHAIWNIIYLIINTSIKNGRGTPRYETVHQIMMEKEIVNNKIHRLRRINIYESEYNLILKYFWPHVASNISEDQKMLGHNQYGGRKHHQAHDIVMINEFIMEYHRMQHIPILITQHDNKECFDRTVHNVCNICNRKYKVPKQVCDFVTRTKTETRYYSLTTQGPSKQYYKHSNTSPVCGSGQGSGNAGTEWNFVSIPILSIVE